MIANIWMKKTPYNLRTLANIIESTYSKQIDKDEWIQKTTFSPSKLVYGSGTCPRYWYAAFNGCRFVETFDPNSVDNMQAGTDGHERIQKNVGATVDCDIEVEIKNEDPPIRGFVDLVIRVDGFTVPVEIKTSRTEAFAWRKAKNKPAAYHIVQLLIYLYLLEQENGLIMYEDKNDHEKLLIPIKLTDKNREYVEYLFDWMRTVRSAYEEETLPKKMVRKNAKICRTCPVVDWCDSADKEGAVEIPMLKVDYDQVDF